MFNMSLNDKLKNAFLSSNQIASVSKKITASAEVENFEMNRRARLFGCFHDVPICEWKDKKVEKFEHHMFDFSAEEVASLSQIRHKNIVEIYGQDDTYFVLMEYSDCGLLTDYLHGKEQRDYTVRDLLSWMHQAAEGLKHIYLLGSYLNVQYINPSKLMLFHNFSTLKIGISPKSLYFDHDRYASPEEINNQKPTHWSSVYRWGIILWELMTRKHPYYQFEGNNIDDIILIGERPQLGDICVPNSDSIKTLIEKCWNSILKRPSIEELLAKVEDFLKNFEPKILEHVLTAGLGAFINFEEVKLDKQIRDGHFGTAYKATWYSLTVVAKQIKHNSSITDRCIAKRCSELMSISRHGPFLSMYGIAMRGEVSYFIMEYVEGETLFDFFHKATISIGEAMMLMRHLADAITYILCEERLNPIYLCNMKSTNIVMKANESVWIRNPFNLTICNFCLTFDINALKDNLSPAYTAPEVFKEGVFTEQSIVYTFGIIFWEVLSRKKAFYEYKRENETRNAVKAGKRPQLKAMTIRGSYLLEDFISQCWDPEPAKRHKLSNLYTLVNKYSEAIIGFLIKPLNIDFEDITELKCIGESKFGIVYKAVWRDLDVSVKKCKSVKTSQQVQDEITQLLHVYNENVVRLYGIVCDIDIVHLVMDYADCGSLHNYLHGEKQRDYTEMNVIHWMHQAAEGITYLHNEENIIHCNLNSQNMLLFENYWNLKISDFCFPADQSSRLDYQDNAYVAPEIFDGESYSKESDVYSFGIILWEAMLRKKPFSEWEQPFSYTKLEELRKGLRPPLNNLKKSQFTYVGDTIKKCWDGNPIMRPTITDVAKLMQLDPNLLSILEPKEDHIVKFLDISLGNFVEKGTFGDIYNAKWCEKEIAVQKYKKDVFKADFQIAIRDITQVRHANILKFYGITFDEIHAFVLMDYPQCISLESYLYGEENLEYTFSRGISWMIQCAKGLAYLHSMMPKPLYHGLLTSYNILLLQAENYRLLKLSDLGMAETLFDFQSIKLWDYCTDERKYRLLASPELMKIKDFDFFDLATILMEVMTRSKDWKQQTDTKFYLLLWRVQRVVSICISRNIEMKWVVSELIEILTTCEAPIVSLLITKDWWRKISFDEIENKPVVPVNFKDIEMGERIDSGSYGTVFKAKWNNKTYAVKQITIPKELEKEIKFLKLLEHENIIQLYKDYDDSGFTYLIMEYADCGSLYNHLHGNKLRNYTMSDAISWMTQLVKAIVFIHGKTPPIIHRDLKTKNILLMDEFKRLKICDFGTVKELATNNTDNVGTKSYIAPEVYKGSQYTEKCDIYSFGIVLWEVMSRRKPFDHLGNRDPETVMYQTTMEKRPQLSDVVPKNEELLNLIEICWHHDPMQRPAASSINLLELPRFDIDIQKTN